MKNVKNFKTLPTPQEISQRQKFTSQFKKTFATNVYKRLV